MYIDGTLTDDALTPLFTLNDSEYQEMLLTFPYVTINQSPRWHAETSLSLNIILHLSY